MKVSELIVLLQTLPQDSIVILSQDAEGNGYSVLSDHDTGKIPARDARSYRLDTYYSDSHSDAECCLETGERDNMVPVVVLWPT